MQLVNGSSEGCGGSAARNGLHFIPSELYALSKLGALRSPPFDVTFT